MDSTAAVKLIRETFENPFEKERFRNFTKNLLSHVELTEAHPYSGNLIPDAYESFISTLERIGKYSDSEDHKIDILTVKLKKGTSLDRARTMQRNFVAWYLNGSRGGELKDAALVAFVSPDEEDWRFSLVKMDYRLEESLGGKIKVKTELTPARRWSFLVGKHESSHTAQKQLLRILESDKLPQLSELENAFNIEVVTREFFEKYRGLFDNVKEALEDLVKESIHIQKDFTAKEVDIEIFSKKLLGQIAFLYFLQKKGWLGVPGNKTWGEGDRRFLRSLFAKCGVEGKNFFNEYLEYLFYDALNRQDRDTVDPGYYKRFDCNIPFLNGGLFDPINNYDWKGTDIQLSNELFSNDEKMKEGDTGTGILDVFDRYNFTVKEDEPLEKEVAIDPEMLGKVFENLLEVKDRKSKGTYYTPREIVHYMCQESLINYLDTVVNTGEMPLVKEKPTNLKLFGAPAFQQQALKTPGNTKRVPWEDIEAFVRMGELAVEHDARVESTGRETKDYSYKLPESIRWNAKLIDDKLACIRVCDPAIGSGAFLVGMMTEIVHARNTLTTYMPDKEGRTPYHFKRDAIQNCLYGVDIDPGAIEIARLRLWRSLVVDEEDIKQIQPLPNLDYKIVCGNSLLGIQARLLNHDLTEKVRKLKAEHIKETASQKKQEYRQQIDELLRQLAQNDSNFYFQVYFSEVFDEKGGFDVVIANPPYVRHEKIKDLKSELKKSFECYDGTADIYIYFYERGIQLLNKNGALTFISSNKYFRSGYGERLRRYLANNCQICRIIDFGDAPVFEAIAYPSIIVLKNTPPQENEVKVFNWQPGPPLAEFASIVHTGSSVIAQKELTSDGWRLEPLAVLRLLEKLSKAGKSLGEYVNGRFYRGILTGLNEAFIVDSETRYRLISEHPSSAELLKPFLRGRDIKRWHIDYTEHYLIKIESSENKKHSWSGKIDKEAEEIFSKTYPSIYNWLKQFRQKLLSRDDQGQYFWESRSCKYWKEFELPKIAWGNLAKQPQFAFVEAGYYVNAPANIIVSNSKYLLGILNSKITHYLVLQNAAQRQGGFVEFKPMYISPLAIPEEPQNECISGVIDQILAITRDEDYTTNAIKQAKVKEYERQIDLMVYQLYALTSEEIVVVEGFNKK